MRREKDLHPDDGLLEGRGEGRDGGDGIDVVLDTDGEEE